MGRNARLAKKSSKIGGVLYFILGTIGFLFAMAVPIQVTLNDYTTRGRLWELTSERGPFTFLLIVLLVPFIFGVIGLYLSRNLARKPTTGKAIFFIIAGFISVFFFVGFVYIFAGIQTLMAKKELDVLSSKEELLE